MRKHGSSGGIGSGSKSESELLSSDSDPTVCYVFDGAVGCTSFDVEKSESESVVKCELVGHQFFLDVSSHLVNVEGPTAPFA